MPSRTILATLLVCCLVPSAGAKVKKTTTSPSSLEQFMQRVRGPSAVAASTSPGSLWPLDGGPLTDLAVDYKARRMNDIVIINIVEQTLAQASGNVTAQRTFSSNSAVTGMAGQVNTAPVNPLYALNSSNNLKGTGTANSTSLLRTSVAGRVVAVLPNGCMVVEAERQISFNQQNQTIILRGLVRPGDIASDNSVLSTSLSDLELELKGKGVVTDAVRQPNLFIRVLTKLLNF